MENKHKGGDTLTRDDFTGGPVCLDLIEDCLYLGNVTAACDINTLNSRKITHILTIDSVPLPRNITESSHFKMKFIQVSDMPKEDILSYFEETNSFIKSALDSGGVILVHCYYGMSRSASIVIAYMMNKYSLSYKEAYERVKSKRRLTCPNPGFTTQLKLYELMGCKLDKSHVKYRSFRLKIAAEKVRRAKILPQSFMDLVKPDPSITQARPEPLVYRCRKCRRIVASQSNIIPHNPKIQKNKTKPLEAQSTSNSSNTIAVETKEDTSNESCSGETDISNLKLKDDCSTVMNILKDGSDQLDTCTKTYFVEPLAWMKGVTQNTQGKLYCPHCKNKLGSFSWLMGCQCPCGIKVSPAFYLVPSKVEWSNVVQNVQVTV